MNALKFLKILIAYIFLGCLTYILVKNGRVMTLVTLVITFLLYFVLLALLKLVNEEDVNVF